MEGRHKEFNNYLENTNVFYALTQAFAKLFDINENDRLENRMDTQRFIQHHMDNKFHTMINYENLVEELRKTEAEAEEIKSRMVGYTKSLLQIDPKKVKTKKAGEESADEVEPSEGKLQAIAIPENQNQKPNTAGKGVIKDNTASLPGSASQVGNSQVSKKVKLDAKTKKDANALNTTVSEVVSNTNADPNKMNKTNNHLTKKEMKEKEKAEKAEAKEKARLEKEKKKRKP